MKQSHKMKKFMRVREQNQQLSLMIVAQRISQEIMRDPEKLKLMVGLMQSALTDRNETEVRS